MVRWPQFFKTTTQRTLSIRKKLNCSIKLIKNTACLNHCSPKSRHRWLQPIRNHMMMLTTLYTNFHKSLKLRLVCTSMRKDTTKLSSLSIVHQASLLGCVPYSTQGLLNVTCPFMKEVISSLIFTSLLMVNQVLYCHNTISTNTFK